MNGVPIHQQKPKTRTAEQEAADFLAECVDDPLLFVLGVFDWSAFKATPEDPEPGPDAWQTAILLLIKAKHLTITEALQIAVASGHGPGKSALIAWIVLWFINCKPHANGVVTANTSKQLTGKTWREIGLWLARMRAPYKDPWVLTATKLYHRDHERTWFIAAIEWSEKNPDAFAGLHAVWVLVVFDEAASIPKIIWETVSGAMTTPHAMWIVFGNPTKNTGSFFECFHKFRHRWCTYQVDSRSAKMTNKRQIAQWVDDYGEDSDFIRVRVRGVFPRSGAVQFIGNDAVEASFTAFRNAPIIQPRDTSHANTAYGALVLGCDIARFGDDATSIWWRRGRYARRLARYFGKDTVAVAGYIAEFIDELEPEMVFIDGAGLGAGVIDQLRSSGYGTKIFEFIGATTASNDKEYKNKRSETWGFMKLWLKAGGMVEPDQQVLDDITGPEYFYDIKQRLQLEAKDDMKARGLASPDNGDAISMTFTVPVKAKDREEAGQDRYGKGTGGTSWMTA